MKKHLLFLFVCFSSFPLLAQYNFGFEEFKPGTDTLVAWNRKSGASYFGTVFNIDSIIKHSGNQSLSIERKTTDTATQFTPINVWIPANFEGQQLTASCWLKTENVGGYAQLWLRIDDESNKLLSLTNYPRNSLKGTTDWTEYTTSVTIPEDAHIIFFGFLITGPGKVWADDFNLLVDGRPLASVKKVERKTFPATKDNKEFAASSLVTLNDVTNFQTESLSLLGKVWGFLKYYHPFVATGNLNWDYELFRFLPSYLPVKNRDERNFLLLQWINKWEKPAICDACSDKALKKAIYKPDLDWISDKYFLGDSLSEALDYIRQNRHQGKNYYMDLAAGVENPKVIHENAYSNLTYPDAGYRLLTLFRYWNLIQYWFPYKHLIGEDWKNVLNEFIPKMIHAGNAAEYVLATQQLIGSIHDTHANIWGANKTLDSLKGKFYPPVKLTFVGEQAVVSQIIKPEIAAASNLQRGDIILSINSKKVEDIIKEKLPNLPASNRPTQLRDLSALLLRSSDSTASLSILRSGKKLGTNLIRYIPKSVMDTIRKQYVMDSYKFDFPYQKDSSFFFIRPNIGYINLGAIKRSQLDSVFKVLEKSDGLIIDNRQYPGDFALYDMAQKILPEKTEFTKIPAGSLNYPGMFSVNETLSVGKKNNDYYKGKIMILINENTQSSGEFHTMAFRTAPGATVVGSTTAGADGNVSGFYLPGGIYTMFSGISILYPDGTETQRIGIVPDVEAKRTVEGIKEGRDELVEKAVQLITGERKNQKPVQKKAF
ncbi:MAG: S41 family peptidase [Bacteroidota bacterium]